MKPKIKKGTKVISISFDASSDAGYIYLVPEDRVKEDYVRTKPFDHGINLDLDKSGYILGIEVLWVREQIQRWFALPKPKDPNLLSAYKRKGPLRAVKNPFTNKDGVLLHHGKPVTLEFGDHIKTVMGNRMESKYSKLPKEPECTGCYMARTVGGTCKYHPPKSPEDIVTEVAGLKKV